MAGSTSGKRPRLSLQIKTGLGPSTRSTRLTNSDPKSPTAFNTLSNIYATAIERSTPVQETPLTAINMLQTLRIQTPQTAEHNIRDLQQRVQTPYATTYPDTPLTANSMSPVAMEMKFPSTMTATPPLSAGPVEPPGSKTFGFAPNEAPNPRVPPSPMPSRRRFPPGLLGSTSKAPYTHPRTLHSILRNSPLPPSSAKSPRRQSLRLQEKAARRVGYVSPLTQTITTEKYTKSHIDLLEEEPSPFSPSPAFASAMVRDSTMAVTSDDTRDAGETPQAYEQPRRRNLNSDSQTPVILSPVPEGIKKRRRKEKKRKWVWTINQEEDEEEGRAAGTTRTATELPIQALAANSRAVTPEPLTAIKVSVEPLPAEPDSSIDVEMTDVSSVASSSRGGSPFEPDGLDMKTPTMGSDVLTGSIAERLASSDLVNPDGKRRDTPVPPDLATT